MDLFSTCRTRSNGLFERQEIGHSKLSKRSNKVADVGVVHSKLNRKHASGSVSVSFTTKNCVENIGFKRRSQNFKPLASIFKSILNTSKPDVKQFKEIQHHRIPVFEAQVEESIGESSEREILDLQNRKVPLNPIKPFHRIIDRPHTPATLDLIGEVNSMLEQTNLEPSPKINNEVDLILDLVKEDKEIPQELKQYAKETVHLDLSKIELSNNDLGMVVRLFKNLTSLVMPKNVNDNDIGYVLQLPYLSHLNLAGCDNITDKGLESVRQHECIENLNLSGCFNVTGVSFVTGFSCINTLDLSYCLGLSHGGIKTIALLKTLRELSLECCDHINDVDIQAVAKSNSLERVNLSGCNITGVGFNVEKPFPSLCHLDLSESNITDVGLEIISKFPTLKSIDLSGCRNISSNSVVNLKLLLNLEVEYIVYSDSEDGE